jgi:hypothetical protein
MNDAAMWIAVAIVAIAAVVAITVVTVAPRRTAAPPELEVIVVTMETGGTIRGVLRERMADAIILASAARADIDPNGRPYWLPLDGEVVIPHSRIDFWQRLVDPSDVALGAGAKQT